VAWLLLFHGAEQGLTHRGAHADDLTKGKPMRSPATLASAVALAVLCQLAFATEAWAAPKLEISVAQLKEVVETRDGKQTVRLVPTAEAKPGDVVQYVLTYVNRGDQVARDAVIDDPIPKGTTYLANTAAGEGAEIAFSNDGGKTYAPAVKLTYELKLPNGAVEKRVANPSDYTHVRWTLKSVAPGARGTVSFKVKVN
jgi:uncharacterized repeat protein (TIGR01451 family)